MDSKAIKEAQILGVNVKVVASSEESKFDHIPQVEFSDNADYAYICSNNTIYGTQFKNYPKTKAPLIVDASSDFFSRKVDFSNIALFYGGVQKCRNFGHQLSFYTQRYARKISK